MKLIWLDFPQKYDDKILNELEFMRFFLTNALQKMFKKSFSSYE